MLPVAGGQESDAWQGCLWNGKKIQIYITPGKEVCIVPHYSWLNGAQTHDRGLHIHAIIIYRSIIQEESILQNCPTPGYFSLFMEAFPLQTKEGRERKRKLW